MNVTVLFEMTLDEARLVRDLMNFVGGTPENTRRRLADAVRHRLDPVLGASPFPMPDMTGAVYCDDRPRTLSIFERDILVKLERPEAPRDPLTGMTLEVLEAECAECHGDCPECNPCGAKHPMTGAVCVLDAGHEGLHKRGRR